MLTSLDVNAAFVSFNAGDFKFTGEAYIDTTLPTETRGIGRVTTITQGSNIIWSNGDNGEYIAYTFEGIVPVVSPAPPTFNFVGSGGVVNFFSLTSDVFNPGQDFLTQKTLYQTGVDYLTASIYGDVIGIATGVSYSANGFLNVVSGIVASLLDTNSRTAFDGTKVDMSFGLSGGANNNPSVNSSYQYITSIDAQGASTVPTPEPLALIGLGLLMVSFLTNKKRLA